MSSLRSGGNDPRRRRRPIVLHSCGAKVRLGADGWGFCRECRVEFNGRDAWVVPR